MSYCSRLQSSLSNRQPGCAMGATASSCDANLCWHKHNVTAEAVSQTDFWFWYVNSDVKGGCETWIRQLFTRVWTRETQIMPTRFDLRCESEKSIVGEQTAHKAITNQLKQLHSKHSQDFQRRDCCPHWQEHDRLESQGIWGRGICSPKHLRSNQSRTQTTSRLQDLCASGSFWTPKFANANVTSKGTVSYFRVCWYAPHHAKARVHARDISRRTWTKIT